jgi:TRAP-type mannitol/chloroaromatic compound transport system permease small subunit
MLALSDAIDALSRKLGHIVAWLALLMVLMTFYNVVSRYVFNSGIAWQQELVRFCHAILFLGAAAYAMLKDEHVRIDVFYQRYSERGKAWCNLLGTLLLLYPVCAAILYFSWGYVLHSWNIHESSNEYRGMPGIFLLKSFIWIFAATLMLQGASVILKSVHTLRNFHG